jgi:phosphopantetheinyl transferase (holo-ACP synthase)
MITVSNRSPVRSTGNDIVALNGIDKTRTRQPRFYTRILSVSEQALYDPLKLAGTRFEDFVWLLWSIKESAYKYVNRSEPGLLFSPTKLIVRRLQFSCGRLESPAGDGEKFFRGMVVSGSHALYFRSTMSEEFIATIVHQEDSFDQCYWGVQRIDNDGYAIQSAAVRELALNRLHALIPGEERFRGRNLQIVKNSSGCPLIIKAGAELDIPVSLAHHGHYIAYSFVVSRTIFH